MDDFENLCKCPYHKSCHTLRQRGQIQFGNKADDCDFYVLLKPMYEKQAAEALVEKE